LYENKKPIIFKQISNTDKDDITTYILQTYKIKIDNIINLDNKLYENCKKEYFSNYYKKNTFLFHTLYLDKSYQVFQIFVLGISLIFGYILFNNIINGKKILIKSSKEVIILENRYNELLEVYKLNNKKPINTMIDFFKYIKLNGIKIKKVTYKNTKIQTILIHKNKKILLDIITMYANNIIIKSIKYDKNEVTYKMEILIEL
jgi:hypothetical protein